MKPLLVIAGEASGDLHGGEILGALKARRPDLRIVGIGGACMTPFLDRKLADVRDLGVVGFVEVVKHLPDLMRLKRQILQVAEEEELENALFIDYPGFNLRMAGALKARLPHIRLHHYVCPQVWAWKPGRIPVLGRTLDTLYCLFDFEPPLFAGHPVEAVWIGHPLVEVVKPEISRAAFFAETGLDPERPLVALLPGSRKGEVDRLMRPLVELVKAWPHDAAHPPVQWALAVAPTLSAERVRAHLHGAPIHMVEGRSYALRAYADAALVCSGTATLETALLGTPFVILYKLNLCTYALAKRLVTLPHFGLANVVAGRKVVTELLQAEVNPARLEKELLSLLEPEAAAQMRAELSGIRAHLGEAGAAERMAAHLVQKMERA